MPMTMIAACAMRRRKVSRVSTTGLSSPPVTAAASLRARPDRARPTSAAASTASTMVMTAQASSR